MSDVKFTITTTSKINVRSGPGITYEVVGSCGAWEMLTAIGVEPDVAGVNWYKIKDNCYVCSKFCDVGIAHPTDSNKKRDDNSNRRIRILSTQDDNDISTNTRIPNITQIGSGLDNSLDSFLNNEVAGSLQVATFKRRIFASPYQFLPSTDIRTDPDKNAAKGDVGRMYASNILREAPILSIMPCKPNYLPSLDQKEKDRVQEALINLVSDAVTDLMQSAAQGTIDDIQTKYFSTDVDYVEYMKYVNALCRGAALFMDLGENTVPGTVKKYKEYNWSHWREADKFQGRTYDGTWESATETAKDVADRFQYGIDEAVGIYERHGSIEGTLRDPEFMELVSTARYYVDFYVTPSTSYSESFSNRTEQSAFANALNKGSDMLKEMTFLMGANALDSSSLTQSMANISQSMRKNLERINNGKDSLFSRLLLDAQTIISGSNIIFPEIWHSSERNQSYRAEIKLVSPYGTREAIFLNTLVPMFHILAFTLPRQTGVNSYGSPFLVKAHINKWFSCEMGVIDSCEIQKGGWTVDGFPSEITISISFKDLYSALPLSKVDSFQSAYCFAMNQSLLEYLSVLCGLNLKTSEFMRKFDMLTALLKNTPTDLVENAYATVQQSVINGVSRIFGNIGGGKL